MRLRKLGVALMAVVALSAIAVSSASAAATTTAAQWYTKATPSNVETTVTGTPTINVAIGNDPNVGTKFVLESESGTKKFKLTATEVHCVGTCVIQNVATTGKTGNVAVATGTLVFTGVTVSEPANCTVADGEFESGTPGQVTTVPLEAHADFMNGTTAVQQFLPKTGATFAIFTLKGASCGVAGTYAVKGTLFTNAVNATGVAAATQEARVSQAIEESDGGGLTIGSKVAKLTGTAKFTLASGEDFLIK